MKKSILFLFGVLLSFTFYAQTKNVKDGSQDKAQKIVANLKPILGLTEQQEEQICTVYVKYMGKTTKENQTNRVKEVCQFLNEEQKNIYLNYIDNKKRAKTDQGKPQKSKVDKKGKKSFETGKKKLEKSKSDK